MIMRWLKINWSGRWAIGASEWPWADRVAIHLRCLQRSTALTDADKDIYIAQLEASLVPFACLVNGRVLDADDDEILFVNRDGYYPDEDRVVTCGHAKQASDLLNSAKPYQP